MAKAAMGYGLVKAGKTEAGLTMLADAVDWFGQARLPFTRTWYTLWLADAHVMIGNPDRARALAEDVLPLIRDCGYRYFEGIAERLLGTSLVSVDPQAAVEHLTLGLQILEDVGARNEVAKALVAQAQVRRVHGDRSAARELLQQALAIFETLGTVDEAPRVRARLAAA
jgi:tetratricopeptide (TPR) repeat protein